MYKQMFVTGRGVCDNMIQRVSDGAVIPFDPANTDYIAFLKWIEEGNVPTPADE
jgi:hypothetical protein